MSLVDDSIADLIQYCLGLSLCFLSPSTHRLGCVIVFVGFTPWCAVVRRKNISCPPFSFLNGWQRALKAWGRVMIKNLGPTRGALVLSKNRKARNHWKVRRQRIVEKVSVVQVRRFTMRILLQDRSCTTHARRSERLVGGLKIYRPFLARQLPLKPWGIIPASVV